MSDDENESEETAVYSIISASGLEYDSTETLSDIVFQIHELVHGPKRDLKMLRDLTEDLRLLVAANEDLLASETLGEIDSLDGLPDGWTSEAPEDGDDEESE